jgi:hypothetical protein
MTNKIPSIFDGLQKAFRFGRRLNPLWLQPGFSLSHECLYFKNHAQVED